MSPKNKNIQSRRTFLRNTGCAALASTTLFSSLVNMKAIAAATLDKKEEFGDYKAMVCILLAGGADSHNMLIPRGGIEYNEYLTTRSNLAIPQSQILPLNHTAVSGKLFGVHPEMPQTQSLFNSGKLAWLSNVGTLIEPITKAQYESNSALTPLGLFSHSDQIKHWQTGRPGDRTVHGWAGRMADLIQSQNANKNLSMNVSLSGNNFFQSGNNTNEFSIKSSGEFGLDGYATENNYHTIRDAAINDMLERDYADIYKKTYINTMKKSLEGSLEMEEALASVGEFNTQFSNTKLSDQLKMIAKVIGAREELGFSRQTFFINLSGWDHHDEILESQQEQLPILDSALGEFMSVLEELGVDNDVTTFTISDFGRTLTSNGDGSDHAWGGNAMVMGGAVNGGQIFGEAPSLELGSDLMLPRGVLIPTTSASEYFAELAAWYGVSQGDIFEIFPDLENFYSPGSGYPIGFMDPNA
ncbi:DUF1501 domain-containing protein [Cryomorphaceae bacterium 1068]|nr:DUF1501 domain-containing protein [Cryomorphaceae bacterium 1068]